MWMMPLHVNQKSDYDIYDMIGHDYLIIFAYSLDTYIPERIPSEKANFEKKKSATDKKHSKLSTM